MNPQPDKIGRYPVVRLIGRGAMGDVYLARDTELDRDVAIKTVRNAGGTPEEQASFFTRFRNEARAVGRLKHPSIVAIYDVGTDPALGPYLVFEYVEGPTLKRLLAAKGPLGPKALVALSEQIGEALELAHAEGIIHRDIKPDNLLVGRDGRTHLADFGVARVPDAVLTGEGQFLGTPCYAAPETLRSGDYGPLSDQFSFAAVLYEVATGARAFPGEEAMSVAQRVIHEEPVLPTAAAVAGSRVPRGLDAVLMRGLSKRPDARFESVLALVNAVRGAYAEAGAVTASGEGLPQLPSSRGGLRGRNPRFDKRPLLWWPFAAALAIGLVALVQLSPRVPGETPAPPEASPSTPVEPGAREPGPAAGATGEATGKAAVAPEVQGVAPARAGDASVDGGAPAPPVEALSGFEREERAKDALERAQRALDAGDKAAAKTALDEAFRYDPEQPDIEALRARL